jgi:membrane peptidoglycan carboxypeptidase
MVFLVSLLPGPVKYQGSFEDGVPTPYFDGLMATLLAKLAAASALSEAEYVAALAAPLGLQIAPEPLETARPAGSGPQSPRNAPSFGSPATRGAAGDRGARTE